MVSVGAFQSFAALLSGETHFSEMLDLVLERDLTSVVRGPLRRLPVESFEVAFVHLRDHRVLRVICANPNARCALQIVVIILTACRWLCAKQALEGSLTRLRGAK